MTLPREASDCWSVHPAQRGLIAARARGGAVGANCAFAYQIEGSLDPQRLADAYRTALSGFDALDLALTDGGTVERWTCATAQPTVEVRLSDLSTGEAAASADIWARRAAAQRFDPVTARHGAISLVRLSDQRWLVVEAFDHLTADGRSLALLHDAVEHHYAAPDAARRPSASYRDLLLAASQPHERERVSRFWRTHFAGFDTQRFPAVPDAAAAAHAALRIAPDQVKVLERAAAGARATLAVLLFAAHAHAVARYRGSHDVAIFLAADARPAAARDVFGHATSLVPIRVIHDWRSPLLTHLHTVARTVIEAREHLAVDLETLDQIGAPASAGSADATAFVFQDHPARPPQLPGLDTHTVALDDLHHAGGMVTVVHREDDGAMALDLRCPHASVLREHLKAITETISMFLAAVADRRDVRLGDDRLLPEPAAALIAANAHPLDPFPFVDLAERIIGQLRTRQAPALVEGDQTYSAADLLAETHRRIDALRGAGIPPAATVICQETTAFARIATFVATLHAGAVYVPVDAAAPEAWTTQITQRSSAAACFRGGRLEPRPPGPATQRESSAPAAAPGAGPNDPAYVIFTSGTTGTPKGVVVSRGALSNLIQGESQRFGIGPDSRVLLIAPPTTDPWICHVAGALHAGATLIAASPLAGPPLPDVLDGERITHAFLPAALFATLEPRTYPHLDVIATAGDHARAEAIGTMLSRRVFNIYGPTEATVTATVAELHTPDATVPIGRPIRGLCARVVIAGQASAPPGVEGDLVLGGVGLALGYLDDAEATEAAFAPDPWRPGHRLYRTADRAVLGRDGQLYLRGRADRQVKIRGFRVELGHLEAAARDSGLCTDAHAYTVQPPDADSKRLVLCVEGCRNPDELDAHLRTVLPPHYHPRSVHAVDTLPRLASGKIDEPRLPTQLAIKPDSTALAPQHRSARLAQSWQQVLGTAPRQTDDFFGAGADSLDVLRLVREARARGLTLSPSDIYRHPRFDELAAALDRAPNPLAAHSGSPTTAGLGPSQHWFFQLRLAQPDYWNQQHLIELDPLPSADALSDALHRVLAATAVLRRPVGLDASAERADTDPVRVSVQDTAPAPDALTSLLHGLHRGLDPARGRLLRAAALRAPDGTGVLILVAHHLCVDDWSWTVIEDRLRQAIEELGPLAPDDGFDRFTAAVDRQLACGAHDLDLAAWDELLRSGTTTDRRARPTRHEHLSAPFSADPRAQAERWQLPLPAVLLACLGHGLAAHYGEGATIVDLERNGRSALGELDLAHAVGWIALHHPVRIEHTALTQTSAAALADQIAAVPDEGLSYGALRWSARADLGPRVARFAVNIAGPSSPPAHPLALAVRQAAVPHTADDNLLPYEAALAIRPGPSGGPPRIELAYDPTRLHRPSAQLLLEAIACAPTQTDPAAAPRSGHQSPFDAPLPAAAMQQLMLRTAASAPGVYRPRQILQCLGLDGRADAFLTDLAALIGELEPFRRRFRSEGTLIDQRPAPPTPAAVARHHGGLNSAVAWMDGPDAVDAHAAANGGPLIALIAFEQPGEPLYLATQVHHAALDGHSHRRLLDLIRDLVAAHAAGTPAPARPAARTEPGALRKHIAAEISAAQPPAPEPARPQMFRATRTAHHALASLDPLQLAAIGAWARARGVDVRSAFAAAALAAARELPATPVYLVANGRDPDIPDTQDALGMFWYFQRLAPPDGDLAGLAAFVFDHAARPVRDLRRAAHQWPTWCDPTGIAFNFLKDPGAPARLPHLRTVARRDLFHFRHQLEVALSGEDSARVAWTVLNDADTATEDRDAKEALDRYLRLVGSLIESADGAAPSQDTKDARA